MRGLLMGLALAAAAGTAALWAGCLRSTQFACADDTQCGAGGTCQPAGFCSFSDPGCPSGQRFGDLSGALANQCVGGGSDGGVDAAPLVDAPPDAAPDAACTLMSCDGSDLDGCGQSTTCAAGCSMFDGAHCRFLVPSNDITPDQLGSGLMAFAPMTGVVFNTVTGEIDVRNSNGSTGTVIRAAGSGVIGGVGFAALVTADSGTLGLFTATDFTVASGTIWSGGSGAYPLVLFASDTITVTGTIDVGGTSSTHTAGNPGPGGGNGGISFPAKAASGCGSGAPGGGTIEPMLGGGGGGGGATAGGSGGGPNPGDAGAMCGATTRPLLGGNGGGLGGSASGEHGGNGGPGGGALQLVAMNSITLAAGSLVTAPGGGAASDDGGGGGGGGAGAILIESISIDAEGILTANGGGGGAANDGNNGKRGSTMTSTPAAGGNAGAGGAGETAPTNGADGTVSDGNGGGGAYGAIEVRSINLTPNATLVSPDPMITTAVAH